MTARHGADAGTLSGWLIAGIFAAVAVLVWFGFTTNREWQRSSELLMTRRADEMADLLVRALARDMRGAQDRVLRSLQWQQVNVEQPYEIVDLVSTAFARYPYPECFFAWSRSADASHGMFFARSDRLPEWLPRDSPGGPFPVAIILNEAESSRLVQRALLAATHGREFAVYETGVGGEPYQVVARLIYSTSRRERLEGVFAFVVNLNWVRDSYFRELTSEVERTSQAYEGLDMVVLDEEGVAVAGTPIPASQSPTTARSIQPLFFDPALVAVDPPADLPLRDWSVHVSAAGDPSHASALRGAERTLAVTTAAAVVIGFGLLLTGRAVRASARLAQLRADFVSSVTHELKTPLSTISVVAETLARGWVPENTSVREYAQILGQESKRLTRLVDNLLAYSRVTDVGGVYSIEPLAVADVMDDIVRRFRPQFIHQGAEAQIDIPPDLPLVAADRTAVDLAFDNVIDNALRYSGDSKWIGISAQVSGKLVEIAVRDRGIGISPDDLLRVETRFVRGRHVGHPGSGLGLAIASRIVRDHGGQFEIESTEGQGTTVYLRIPVSEV